MPLAFGGGAYGGGARRAGQARTGQHPGNCPPRPQPDEHEHQADEAERADRAGNRRDSSRPVPVKARGLPPHPPWDDGAEPEPVKSAYGILRIGCADS